MNKREKTIKASAKLENRLVHQPDGTYRFYDGPPSTEYKIVE